MATNVSDVWGFKKDGDGLWTWRLESLRHEVLREAPAPFKQFEQCVADARRFGYTGSMEAVEEPQRDARRRLRRLTAR